MPEVGINHFILLSAILLGLGIYTTVSSKSITRIVIGIVMIFTSSLINISAFSGIKNFNIEGQVILFITGGICALLLIAGIMLGYSYYKEHKSTIINE